MTKQVFDTPVPLNTVKVKPNTVYKIKVSLYAGNYPHHSLFWVGFTKDDGTAGAYSTILNNTYEEMQEPRDWFGKAMITEIEEVISMEEY